MLITRPSGILLVRRAPHCFSRGLAVGEASGKHVPWGVLGEGRYSAATKGCLDVIVRTQPLVREALALALASREVAGTANVTPFSIADFGAADAGTSLSLMRSAVAAVRAAEPDAPIIVQYEDQALNDWQSVFQLTGGSLVDGAPTYMTETPNVYVLASGTSFYEQCFAPCSVDFSFSSTAMHWLTDIPCTIPDALHSSCSADGATRAAFSDQAARDWERILLHRAAELKPGGQFVVANFAVDTNAQFLGETNRVSESMHQNFSELWLDVSGPEVHAATTFCNEYRSLSACIDPFVPGTAVAAAGLELRSAKTDLVECPFHAEWTRGEVRDAATHAARFIPTTRTWSNSTFVSGALRCGIDPAEAAALVDEMFARYESRVAAVPNEHAMDYVHSYLHIAKAR